LCARGRFLLFSDADGATKFSDFSKLEKEMFSLCNGENEEKEQFNGESSIDWTHPALVVGSRAHLADEAIAKRSLLRTVLMLGFHAMVFLNFIKIFLINFYSFRFGYLQFEQFAIHNVALNYSGLKNYLIYRELG